MGIPYLDRVTVITDRAPSKSEPFTTWETSPVTIALGGGSSPRAICSPHSIASATWLHFGRDAAWRWLDPELLGRHSARGGRCPRGGPQGPRVLVGTVLPHSRRSMDGTVGHRTCWTDGWSPLEHRPPVAGSRSFARIALVVTLRARPSSKAALCPPVILALFCRDATRCPCLDRSQGRPRGRAGEWSVHRAVSPSRWLIPYAISWSDARAARGSRRKAQNRAMKNKDRTYVLLLPVLAAASLAANLYISSKTKLPRSRSRVNALRGLRATGAQVPTLRADIHGRIVVDDEDGYCLNGNGFKLDQGTGCTRDIRGGGSQDTIRSSKKDCEIPPARGAQHDRRRQPGGQRFRGI